MFLSFLKVFFFLYIVNVYSRGVMVHRYDGSVRTSVLTSRFDMISVQQGEN